MQNNKQPDTIDYLHNSYYSCIHTIARFKSESVYCLIYLEQSYISAYDMPYPLVDLFIRSHPLFVCLAYSPEIHTRLLSPQPSQPQLYGTLDTATIDCSTIVNGAYFTDNGGSLNQGQFSTKPGGENTLWVGSAGVGRLRRALPR